VTTGTPFPPNIHAIIINIMRQMVLFTSPLSIKVTFDVKSFYFRDFAIRERKFFWIDNPVRNV
jgi:hypothetical protein